jgi:integrase
MILMRLRGGVSSSTVCWATSKSLSDSARSLLIGIGIDRFAALDRLSLVAQTHKVKLDCRIHTHVFPNTRGNVESHANIVQRGVGTGAKRVQALMGHGSIQMTFDVYGHLFPQ